MKREAFNHPKMLDLATRLGITRTHACGIIANLWNWAADTAAQGNIGKWSDAVIARSCEWDGDAAEFVGHLCDSGWLDRCTVHRLVIHDLEEHAPEWLKTKLKRTGKWFYIASQTSQCTGANARANAPASDQREPSTSGASAPLFSSLLCSSLETSSNPDSAPGEVSPQAGESGVCSDSMLTEETLADPAALDRWIEHDSGRPDAIANRSEAFRVNVHAAAAKARTASGIRDPIGFVKWVIRGKRWNYLRAADDDVAKLLQREVGKANREQIAEFASEAFKNIPNDAAPMTKERLIRQLEAHGRSGAQ